MFLDYAEGMYFFIEGMLMSFGAFMVVGFVCWAVFYLISFFKDASRA